MGCKWSCVRVTSPRLIKEETNQYIFIYYFETGLRRGPAFGGIAWTLKSVGKEPTLFVCVRQEEIKYFKYKRIPIGFMMSLQFLFLKRE
jgi:hypothetical protein